MDSLTNEDVADILALLDSLPYDELDLATSRFRLTLRRAASGGWTQSRQETAEPRGRWRTGRGQGRRGAGGGHGAAAGNVLPGARPGAAPFVEVGTQVSAATV